MKFFKRESLRKIFVVSSVLLLLLVIIAPPGLEARRRAECRRAYIKCGTNAVLLTIANPTLGIAWAAGCIVGYVWCLEFFG
ncbi:MAG: hypothetical protein GTO17_10720 [Candidatus Aminicenantes bacterium]|nr:hypothetical protein [Candidatus Aminicenantes bacterium]